MPEGGLRSDLACGQGNAVNLAWVGHAGGSGVQQVLDHSLAVAHAILPDTVIFFLLPWLCLGLCPCKSDTGYAHLACW